MDRTVFMTFDDFVKINAELLERTGLALFRSESYDHPFVRIERINANAWRDSGLRAMALLIGHQSEDARIIGQKQPDVTRASRVGFVNVRFGGEDTHAIGSTWYAADASDTEKLVSRELNKLLRKYAHKGVVGVEGDSGRILANYYWTDAALASGKNWHRYLGVGVRKDANKDSGYRPKPD
ncbi:hypothetical protein [Burkholderia plantarii]|uniref:hypothetical protein n=1 Tax=Burkholderia plantarii TaxID=41899 RepID=UPI000F4D59BC|nr:hypothetical protein [Burkholderia plantarii]